MGLVVVPTLYDDESSILAWIKSKFPLAQKRCLELSQSQSRLESGAPESSRHLSWAKRAGFSSGIDARASSRDSRVQRKNARRHAVVCLISGGFDNSP